VATFRPATPGDLGALLELQAAYYAEDGYSLAPSVARDAWSVFLADESLGCAWVVEAGSQAIGYLVLTLGYSLEHRGRDAFIDELYVSPPWRGQGLGGQALTLADRACRERGVKAVHLEVEREKAEAQSLYRRWGFRDRERILMTKSVR
jgi:ribosomal protein S18 acetylase RimI-like enzyme